jgi:hypothetical protein
MIISSLPCLRRALWTSGLLLAVTLGAWALCLWGPSLPRAWRSAEHVAVFALWSACLWLWLDHGMGVGRRRALVLAALGGVAAAGVGEGLQAAMANHTPEWRGFAWSVLGVVVGVGVGWGWRRWRRPPG